MYILRFLLCVSLIFSFGAAFLSCGQTEEERLDASQTQKVSAYVDSGTKAISNDAEDSLKRADRMGYDVWGVYFDEDSKIIAENAVNHIGQIGVVCGKVESTHYAENSRGSPTYLNLGKPYPDQVFTVVIWGRYRQKFDKPEQTYKGKQICVRGKITEYQGIPQIEVVGKEYISFAGSDRRDPQSRTSQR